MDKRQQSCRFCHATAPVAALLDRQAAAAFAWSAAKTVEQAPDLYRYVGAARKTSQMIPPEGAPIAITLHRNRELKQVKGFKGLRKGIAVD